MKKLTNFVLGAALAGLLLGPVAWADARQVMKAGVTVATVIHMGAPVAQAHAVGTVRSALLPNRP